MHYRMSEQTQILEGLSMLAQAVRTSQRDVGQHISLIPAQSAALALVHSRQREGITVQEVAATLGVSQPTATETVAALVRKGLVRKQVGPHDRRERLLFATARGAQKLNAARNRSSAMAAALASLGDHNRGQLTRSLMLTIRALQVSGAIVPQKLCVSCRHFRPNMYPDAARPHHCAFVNAAFGNSELRFACSDHETSTPAEQAATCSAFSGVEESLRAT